MRLPEGYTYSSYARQGFFQLLAVCIINLIIVLVCLGFFRESRVLKGILTVISLCTYIMVASSAYRMILYIQICQLTFLRIIVLWALAVTALVLGLSLIHISFLYVLSVQKCFWDYLPFFRRRNPCLFWLMYQQVRGSIKKRQYLYRCEHDTAGHIRVSHRQCKHTAHNQNRNFSPYPEPDASPVYK